MSSNKNRHRLVLIGPSSDIAESLSRKLMGQPAAISAIVPFVQLHRANLNPEGRPAGVFLLLGPTGTGKTKTVEALAQVLHGCPKRLLRVDCGEYQMEHEVAKLIGAPPGYLGHRETQPLLTQQKVNAATSESCDLSLLLFDEIEKAASSMVRLLLGVLDKAALRLGDNTTVNFEKTLIFLTSNIGASEISRELQRGFGFEGMTPRTGTEQYSNLQKIGMSSVRKQFSPEFVNRIDATIVYRPLSPAALRLILDQQIRDLEDLILRRLGDGGFHLEVTSRARRFLLDRGTSEEYGARELNRTIQRQLVQPLGALVAGGEIAQDARIRADLSSKKDRLIIREVGIDRLLRME
jgi:ATP-dependent Clp protease ATP-binding subunit ClpA